MYWNCIGCPWANLNYSLAGQQAGARGKLNPLDPDKPCHPLDQLVVEVGHPCVPKIVLTVK